MRPTHLSKRADLMGKGLLVSLGWVAAIASGCGGGGMTQTGPPPPPTITVSVIDPSFTPALSAGFSMIVDGAGFTPTSVVRWNGNLLPTVVATDSILTATVSNALVAIPGDASISVKDTASGVTSNTVTFAIQSAAAATAGVVQLISAAPDGSPGNSDSLVNPSISQSGRYVAFQSSATNLVSQPVSSFQIYIRDTCIGADSCAPSTQLVSVANDGSPGNSPSRDSSVSADGRYVVFDSAATNLIPAASFCGPSLDCVYLRDTCIGAPSGCVPTTSLASIGVDGTAADGGQPQISPDGRYLVFNSTGTVPGVNNVYIRDTCIGAPSGCVPTTSPSSVNSIGALGNANSEASAVDSDGRFVGFVSYASNLLDPTQPPADTSSMLFVRDSCLGASDCTPSTTRVDLAPDGSAANMGLDYEAAASISWSGRYISFSSSATNLVATNVNGFGNVYLRDTCATAPAGCTPLTSLVSLANDGSVANSGSHEQSMSADGRFVSFTSIATNLVANDGFAAGSFEEVFVRDTCTGAPAGCTPSTVRLVVTTSPNPQTPANAYSFRSAISGDGHYAVFLSTATNLTTAGGNGHTMVFLAKTGF